MTLDIRIRHRFGAFALDVDVTVPPGLTVLFGRSGSGKTSIVNALAGLLRPEEGRIAVDGTVLLDTASGLFVPPHRRRLGCIFQDARLFPHLTVRRNLLYGQWFSPSHAQGESLGRVVELLGIRHLLERRPGALSGGERQRVAIGRALLSRPRLILADEPLAALDEPRKAEILPYFERLRDEVSIPILYVSHAPAEVARLATTVVAIEDGRVTRVGDAATVLSDPRVTPVGAQAAGAVIEAVLVAQHDDGLSELQAGGLRLWLPRVEVPAGTRLRVRIEAQEVLLSRSAPEGLSALNVLPGTVEAVRLGGGPGAIVSVRTDAGVVLARVTRRSVERLGLAAGVGCHAIIKTMAVAPGNVGAASMPGP